MTHFCAAVFSKNLKKMLYKVETEKTKELCCLTIQSYAEFKGTELRQKTRHGTSFP